MLILRANVRDPTTRGSPPRDSCDGVDACLVWAPVIINESLTEVVVQSFAEWLPRNPRHARVDGLQPCPKIATVLFEFVSEFPLQHVVYICDFTSVRIIHAVTRLAEKPCTLKPRPWTE